MQKKIKVFHCQRWQEYSNWLPFEVEFVDTIEEADVVFFEGGADVDPSMYGEVKNSQTGSDLGRDLYESAVYKTAQAEGKLCIGVCRGSQFLTAMQPGGILVQHQQNPGFMHMMHTFDHEEMRISSTHHQAMFPFRMPVENYHILAWTHNASEYHQGGMGEELNPPVECEIVYYPKTNCLAIQGHPEMMNDEHPTIKWLQELFTKFVNNTLLTHIQSFQHEKAISI